MNFCKESDKYISLYLDELLDDKSRIEFLKHIEGCSQCTPKLKESSYIAAICREDQGIQLRENFSSSLHERLLEISPKQSKNKFVAFVYNKKFIASLSTAAILAVSLLAYNLLPQMGTSKSPTSMANETVQVKAYSKANGNFGSSEDKSNLKPGGTGNNALTSKQANSASAEIQANSASAEIQADSASSDSTATGTQADIKVTTATADVTVTFSKSSPIEKTQNNVQAKEDQDKAETSPNSNEASKRKENEATYNIMALEDPSDTNKYFSNYAELNLKVSDQRIEIEDFRKFMKEAGAIELKPVTINSVGGNPAINTEESIVENTVESQTETSITTEVQTRLISSQYVDYYLPFNLYGTLKSQATKYKLELSTKTDIIKNDNTDKYNVLNTQISEIDKKITEALNKGEDASTFEADKIKLTEEINKIIAEKEMITVRTFYIL